MKLAELYAESATIWDRLETIREDVQENLQSSDTEVKKQMNETLNELIIEYRVLLERYLKVINRINDLDSKVRVLGYGKMTIAEATEKQKALDEIGTFYGAMLDGVEDPSVATFNVREVRRMRDGYVAASKKLALALEGTSWMVEIVPGSPVGETEEADLESVVHMTARVGEHTEEDMVQAVDNMVETESVEALDVAPQVEEVVEEVKVSKKPSRRQRKEAEVETGSHVVNPTDETAAKERKMLSAALREAQETPREKNPACPVDSSDYSDHAYSVYKVTRDMGKLAGFLESTQDPKLSGLPVRVLQDFINRNFYADSTEVYVPQL